jgi:predicted PurR-regulated permease PerM
MSNGQNESDAAFLRNVMTAFVRIGAVLLLLSWCFQILAPFVNVVVWAAIMAVAVFPLHTSIANMLGGKAKLSATLIVLVGLAVLALPAVSVAGSTIDFVRTSAEQLESGSVTVPPPNDKVKDWPLIGNKVHGVWTSASRDFEATLNRFGPQLTALGKRVLGLMGHGVFTMLQFAISLMIAGAFLVTADKSYEMCCRIATALAGQRGKELTDLSIGTIRSVAKGVLGVAIIQALMALGVLAFWGVPGAGLWTVFVLAVAVMQLPPILVLGPVAVWVFSTAEPLSATVFLVLSLVISFSDMFLKPLLLGRGVEIPMLVVLLGAIGGAVSFGIIGLFVGSVVLAVGYSIVSAWVRDQPEAA